MESMTLFRVFVSRTPISSVQSLDSIALSAQQDAPEPHPQGKDGQNSENCRNIERHVPLGFSPLWGNPPLMLLRGGIGNAGGRVEHYSLLKDRLGQRM
jgi:hypothetical protein